MNGKVLLMLAAVVLITATFVPAAGAEAGVARQEECCERGSSVAKTYSITNRSLKKSSIDATYTESDLRLMSSIIYCEACGESYQGKLAVGMVIMNRVDSSLFPNTIKKVIYEKGQFTPARNGILKKRLAQYDAGKTGSKAWKQCINAAKEVLGGADTVTVKGSEKDMDGILFFCVGMANPKFKLGHHGFR